MKKILIVLAVLLLVGGCGAKGNDPATNFTKVGTIKVSPLSFDYDAGNWQEVDAMLPTIVYKKDMDADFNTNINIQLSAKYTAKLTQNDLDTLLDNLLPYQKVNSAEIQEVDGNDCFVIDTTTKITDELLDLLIQQGQFTEEDIANAGGREAMINMPATNAHQIFAVKNGYLIVFTGSYTTDSARDVVDQGIKDLIKSCKK